MIQNPRLKTYLTVFPISETTWGLQGGAGELWRIPLDGEPAVQAFGGILAFLNGRHAVEDIEQRVGEQGIAAHTVRNLLGELERAGLLEDGSHNGLDDASAARFGDQVTFFSRFTRAGGAHLQATLRDWRVGVVGDSTLGRALTRQLADAGFGDAIALDRRAVEAGGMDPPPQLFVLAEIAHDPSLLEAMDACSKRHDIPWLLVRALDPREAWVGPLFIPGETASYASLEARLRGNLPFFDEYRAFHAHLRESDRPSPPCGGLHPVYELLSGIAVTELIKLATGFALPRLAGRFLTINLMTWESEIHDVLRVPHLEHDSSSRPRVHPWRDLPYGDKQTRRA